MLLKPNKRQVALIVVVSCVHALLSAFFWFFAFGVAMGLGFKDVERWTTADHILAAVVPKLALTLTLPARLLLEYESTKAIMNGFMLLLALLANSLLWATVIVMFVLFLKRRLKAT